MALNFNSNLFPRQIEDALSEKRDAITGVWEFVVDNGLRKINQVSVNNTQDTIYTIPTGKILYLLSVSMSYHYHTSGTKNGGVSISGFSIMHFRHQNALATNQNGENSVSFATPLILTAGEEIIVDSGQVGTDVSGSFSGYEVNA